MRDKAVKTTAPPDPGGAAGSNKAWCGYLLPGSIPVVAAAAATPKELAILTLIPVVVPAVLAIAALALLPGLAVAVTGIAPI